MAFIRFKDNTGKTVSHDKAVEVFRVQHGLLKASESYVEACRKVYKVYLDYAKAPDDYKAKYPRLGDDLKQAEQQPLAYKDSE